MPADQKYIVLKRSDYDRIRQTTPVNQLEVYGLLDEMALGDAVVIRKQDVFASSGLASYANAIQAALDANALVPLWQLEYGQGLEAIRDYFFECATEAAQYEHKKVPD